jgi:uncharacterized membrane protein HdeD (DUF308 family)
MLGAQAADMREAADELTDNWWWFLVAGIGWLLVSLLVFRFDITSVTTVGVLIGVLFLVAAADEFFVAAIRRSWVWAHVLLGALFVLGAIWSFGSPYNAFWALASVFGLLLILSGTMDVVGSTTTRAVNPLWGLGLATGILEILLGFWVSQQFVPARASLLILWIGFMALFRGFSDIVLAFQIKSVRH